MASTAPPPYSQHLNDAPPTLHTAQPSEGPVKFPAKIGSPVDPSSMAAQTNIHPTGPGLSFPKDLGFYHASGAMRDMVIARSADDPHPMHYISMHNGFSSKPTIVLHSGSSESSPVLGYADLSSWSSSTDLVLGDTSPSFAIPSHTGGGDGVQTHVKLEKEGFVSLVYWFMYKVPSTGQTEKFEWRRSSGNEVKALRGKSHGMKLVRLSTGEVVAAWTLPNTVHTKKGKMSFMARDRAALGTEFELAVVLSILALIEKGRRRASGAAAGGGGGGA